MPKGEKAQTNNNMDWWQEPLAGTGISNNTGLKLWKRLLHKMELRMGKMEIKSESIKKE